jgi:hypothetical protein
MHEILFCAYVQYLFIYRIELSHYRVLDYSKCISDTSVKRACLTGAPKHCEQRSVN